MIKFELDEKLDLNLATFEQLKGLCGIGRKLAKQIIDKRPFDCIDDLLTVPGIGPTRFDKLEEQCVVHGNRRPPSGLPSHVSRISFLDPCTKDHICQYISSEEFQKLSNRGLLIFHVNAGCYRSSLFEMENIIMSSLHPPDIVCVSDTGNRSVSFLFLDAYTKFKFPKHDSLLRGKGVAIFIKKSRSFILKERLDLNLQMDDCSNLWIELSFSIPNSSLPQAMWRFYTLIIGVVYRNPIVAIAKIKTFRKNLQNVISEIRKEGKIFYILGDINIDVRKTGNHIVQYCKMLEKENCKLLITKPTRIGMKSDKPGLLDHIYTNDPDLDHVTSGIVETQDVSDHYPIYCHLDFTCLTIIEKQKNAWRNLKLRRMLQPSVYSLKTKGIPYNPVLPVLPFDLFELKFHKGLEHLTTYQTELLRSFRLVSISEFSFPFGDSIVEIVGYEISLHNLDDVFYGSKQTYIIPVYSMFGVLNGYTIANTVNYASYRGEDPNWVFVPVNCTVYCHSSAPRYPSVPYYKYRY